MPSRPRQQKKSARGSRRLGAMDAATRSLAIELGPAGIRVNAKYQAMDRNARVIPGLYCAGESASGFAMHGLAKCLVSGYIAGREAALEA